MSSFFGRPQPGVAAPAPKEEEVALAVPEPVKEIKAPESPLQFRAAQSNEKFRDVVGEALAAAALRVQQLGAEDDALPKAKRLFERLQRLHMMLEYTPELTGEGF